MYGSESGYDQVLSAKELKDGSGGFYVTGYTSGFDDVIPSFRGVLTSKFNSNMSLEWASTLTYDSGEEKGYSLDVTKDGGIILCGFSIAPSSTKDVLLSKYFSNGTVEWAASMGGTNVGKDYGRSVFETSDGLYYIIAGHTKSIGSGDKYYVFLTKLYMNNLTIKWTTAVGGSDYDSDGGDYCYAATELDDGSFIVAGSTTSFGIYPSYNLFLAKFGSDGSFIWSSTFGKSTGNEASGYNIKQTMDGMIVIGGHTENYGAGDSDILLAKFDPSNGELIWVSSLGDGDWDNAPSVEELSDGTLVFAGYIGHDMLLAFYSMDGELDRYFYLDDNLNDLGYVITYLSYHDALLVSGRESYLGNMVFSAYLVGTNGEGCGWKELNVPLLTYHSITDLEAVIRNSETEVFEPSPNYFKIEFWDKYNGSDYGVTTYRANFVQNNTDFVSNVYCSSPNCFDHFGQFACSERGECVDFDHCVCDEGYFGDECEVAECFGFFSNDSDNVCSGHGECVANYTCSNCLYNYFGIMCEYTEPVTFWSSYGAEIGESETARAYSVDVTSDYGWVVAGETEGYGEDGVKDLLVVKYSIDEEVEYAVAVENSNGFQNVKETCDGGFIVEGGTATGEIIVVKFSYNLTMEWCISLLSVYTHYTGTGVVEITNSDGGYIITGYGTDAGNCFVGRTNTVLAKLDSSGNLVWANFMCGEFNDIARSVIITTDGGILLTGESESATEKGMLLAKFNSTEDGELLWAVTVGLETETFSTMIGMSVIETSDNKYVVAGYVFPPESMILGNFLLLKFYSDGVLEWGSSLGGLHNDRLMSVLEDENDGGFVVVGESGTTGYPNKEAILAKYDKDGEIIVATAVGTEYITKAYDFKMTPSGGYFIVGEQLHYSTNFYRVAVGKTDSLTTGCHVQDRTSLLTFEYIFGCRSYEFGEDTGLVFVTDAISTLNHSFISPTIFNVKPEMEADAEFLIHCMVRNSCYGVINDTAVCSGHGNCTDDDVCVCEDNSLYFGENCQFHYCDDILSNDTENVCSGKGKCVDHNYCRCLENYTASNDCSMYECFGLWMNDTTVCNGVHGNQTISRGDCTSHDRCECDENYQQSLSCDWECYGRANWEAEACGGEFGICVDHDECECTTANFTGKYCDQPTVRSNSELLPPASIELTIGTPTLQQASTSTSEFISADCSSAKIIS